MSQSSSSNHLTVSHLNRDIPVDKVIVDDKVYFNKDRKKEFRIPIGDKCSHNVAVIVGDDKEVKVEFMSNLYYVATAMKCLETNKNKENDLITTNKDKEDSMTANMDKEDNSMITNDNNDDLITINENEENDLITTSKDKEDNLIPTNEDEEDDSIITNNNNDDLITASKDKEDNLIPTNKDEEDVSIITNKNDDDLVSVNKDKDDSIITNKDEDDFIPLKKKRKFSVIPNKPIVINKNETAKHEDRLTQNNNPNVIGCSKHPKTVQSSFLKQDVLCNHHSDETDLDLPVSKLSTEQCTFQVINGENLNLKYSTIFSQVMADSMFEALEEQVQYFPAEQLRVKVFKKWYGIPRKQACYGDQGLSYDFKGNSLPARPWSECAIIQRIKEHVESVCQQHFNFVLVNRYKDGKDYTGEHQDEEKYLEPRSTIASVSFGQVRDFILKHSDTKKRHCKTDIPPVTVPLEHGSLLLMEWPTNRYWYHSLPVCANAKNVRINLTFRYMKNFKFARV